MPAPPLTPRLPQRGRTLLTAWLLLLLCDGEGHGWALRNQLGERGLVVDGANVYRHLRKLERDGVLASHWTAPVAGPKRRCYSMAPGGWDRLHELAATISATCTLHAAFVEAQQQGFVPHPPTAAQEAARTPTMGRELLTAWLLLLLDHHASYGYDLLHALQTQPAPPERGVLYRVLRQLDDAGCLQSRWMDSAAGPRQRQYRVTAKGRRHLAELTGQIIAIRDSHRAFLQEYEQARRQRTAEVTER